MINIDIENLASFLVRAKKNTWAGSKGEVFAERPCFREFEYNEGGWNYKDSYVGEYSFGGNEIVKFQRAPVWFMNYDGRVNPRFHGNENFIKRINSFLKRALIQVDVSLPFRGPVEFKEGLDMEGKYYEWMYMCSRGLDIRKFQGFEEIWHRGKIPEIPGSDYDILVSVFELNYGGGILI